MNNAHQYKDTGCAAPLNNHSLQPAMCKKNARRCLGQCSDTWHGGRGYFQGLKLNRRTAQLLWWHKHVTPAHKSSRAGFDILARCSRFQDCQHHWQNVSPNAPNEFYKGASQQSSTAFGLYRSICSASQKISLKAGSF